MTAPTSSSPRDTTGTIINTQSPSTPIPRTEPSQPTSSYVRTITVADFGEWPSSYDDYCSRSHQRHHRQHHRHHHRRQHEPTSPPPPPSRKKATTTEETRFWFAAHHAQRVRAAVAARLWHDRTVDVRVSPDDDDDDDEDYLGVIMRVRASDPVDTLIVLTVVMRRLIVSRDGDWKLRLWTVRVLVDAAAYDRTPQPRLCAVTVSRVESRTDLAERLVVITGRAEDVLRRVCRLLAACAEHRVAALQPSTSSSQITATANHGHVPPDSADLLTETTDDDGPDDAIRTVRLRVPRVLADFVAASGARIAEGVRELTGLVGLDVTTDAGFGDGTGDILLDGTAIQVRRAVDLLKSCMHIR